MSMLASFLLQNLNICVCVCVCARTCVFVCSHVTVCMQRLEDNLWDPVLSQHKGPGERIQAVRLAAGIFTAVSATPAFPLLIQSSSQPGELV